MNTNKTVKEVMTAEVITANQDDLMMTIGDIFDRNNIHHIPIVDGTGKLVGIISKHDYNTMLTIHSLFKKSRAEVANRKYKMSLLAEEVMTKEVVKLRPNDSISVAVGIFKENLFHAIPIVNEEDKVVGILSTFDLLNYAFDERKPLGMNA